MHKLFVSNFVKKFQNLQPKREIYFFCNKQCRHFIKNTFKKLAKYKKTWNYKNAFCFKKFNSFSCYTCYFLLNVVPILFILQFLCFSENIWCRNIGRMHKSSLLVSRSINKFQNLKNI